MDLQVLGCDDCTGLGHGRNLVSVVVARLGADISKASIDSVSILHQQRDVQRYRERIWDSFADKKLKLVRNR